jgi:hypothetical protein
MACRRIDLLSAAPDKRLELFAATGSGGNIIGRKEHSACCHATQESLPIQQQQ